MTLAEAAERLGVSKVTFFRLTSSGQIPLVAVSERRRMIDAADLRAYIKSKKVRRGSHHDVDPVGTGSTVRASAGRAGGDDSG